MHTLANCAAMSGLYDEIGFEPDSTWVHIVMRGMRSELSEFVN